MRSLVIMLACITAAACTPTDPENNEGQSETAAREPKIQPEPDPDREAKAAAYKERFRHFREHPRLTLGRVLSEAEVDQVGASYIAVDRKKGYSFSYNPGRGDEADPGLFTFSYARTPDELAEMLQNRGFGSGYIQGRADRLGSQENGDERILVLSRVNIMRKPAGVTEPYALSDQEVRLIADLFATAMQPRSDRDKEFREFAIYDLDAGLWRPNAVR